MSPFRVLSLDLGDSNEETVKMKARVVFNNDSTTSISSLGVALFDLSYEVVSIGYMQSESPLEVKRGDNIYTFVGELRPQQQQQEPQQQQQHR